MRASGSSERPWLSPRGLNWHFIAHEWSHAEMWTRLSLPAWKRMPQWFDDGIAVAISEAPEHSEPHWQFLVASDVSPGDAFEAVYQTARLGPDLTPRPARSAPARCVRCG